MKKKFLLVAILIMMLLATGCNSHKQTKELICSRSATVTTGVRMELFYKATYKGNYVEMVETEEKIISENSSILETYKTSIERLYSPYKGIEYYNYNIEVLGDTLISTTKIDYSKIDTNKLIEIDSSNASLIKNGKIKISDIKAMYEKLGATCE